MRMILRSMARRRFRTVLTVFGVAMGIFGFVAMGALAEKARIHTRNAYAYYGAYVWVASDQSFFGWGGRLPMSLQKRLEAMDGVEYASPRVVGPLDLEDMVNPFGLSTLVGLDLNPERNQLAMYRVRKGLYPPEGSRGQVLLGDMVARRYRKAVGDTIEVHRRSLVVCGVLERTDTDPDHAAYVSIDDARELVGMESDQCSTFAVRPRAGQDPDDVAARIDRGLRGVHSIPPSKVIEAMEAAMAWFNAMVFAATTVALLASCPSIVVVMVIAASERSREIATKMAVGARTRHVFVEFLAESVVIAATAGALGMLLAYGATWAVNSYTVEKGAELFRVTPRLAVSALVLCLLVGCVAGSYPAWRAARTDPVKVLRSV